MSFTRSKTIWLICVLALALLSFRPDEYVERGFAWLLTPTRILAALASPLEVFDTGVVLAADDEQVEIAREHCREVSEAFRAVARPQDPTLATRAVVIEAAVLKHTQGKRDEVLVHMVASKGVRVGIPAVCGDAYVGRVVELVPGKPNLARVELLTSSSFRVGAEVTDKGRRSDLIVGGLAPRHELTDQAVHLAVHNPSDREVHSGTVFVAEPEALVLDDEDSRLADGFLLGEFREFELRRKNVSAIRPALDFEAGLYHIALLVPLDRAPEEVPAFEDLFAPRAWQFGKLLLAGEVSGWRAGRKLTLEDSSDVARGAAVVRGARFIGRVESLGTTMADVRLISDPGLVIPALALLSDGELVVLGTLVSLGRNEAGRVVLRWETDQPLAATAAFGQSSLKASLYTGSGQRGVPLGLVLGETVLPTRAGIHELELDLPVPGSGRVEVRRVREEGGDR